MPKPSGRGPPRIGESSIQGVSRELRAGGSSSAFREASSAGHGFVWKGTSRRQGEWDKARELEEVRNLRSIQWAPQQQCKPSVGPMFRAFPDHLAFRGDQLHRYASPSVLLQGFGRGRARVSELLLRLGGRVRFGGTLALHRNARATPLWISMQRRNTTPRRTASNTDVVTPCVREGGRGREYQLLYPTPFAVSLGFPPWSFTAPFAFCASAGVELGLVRAQ